MLNSVGEGGQLWRTPLLISASFDILELNYINILFCVYMSTITSSEMFFFYFKISMKHVLYITNFVTTYKKTSMFPNSMPFVFQLTI